MGENSTTQENYTASELSTANIDIYVGKYLDHYLRGIDRCTAILQLPKVSRNGCVLLLKSLVRFSLNRKLFDVEEEDLTLRKHLAFTLFVPGGKASKARQAVDQIASLNLLDIMMLENLGIWEQGVEAVRPLIRFHMTKMNYLREALFKWPEIRKEAGTKTPLEFYTWFCTNIYGFGSKAGAHFMRNTGLIPFHFNDIAIIDTHIYKALDAFQLRYSDKYADAARAFKIVAELTGVPLLLLDAVLWCSYANNWDISNSDFDNFENNKL